MNTNNNMDYKILYEKEKRKRSETLDEFDAYRVDAEKKIAKFNRLKQNPLIKVALKFRSLFVRIKNSLGLGDVDMSEVKRRDAEQKNAIQRLGTASFPNEEKRKLQENTCFETEIKYSILVPLYNTPENFLREMIESVTNQTYKNWELCLADGSDNEHSFVQRICLEYASKDNRIKYKQLEKNEGISGNTNECYKMATGDYIGLFDHDDILHPSVLFEYTKKINEENSDFIYCDEVTFRDTNINDIITVHFKPDFAPDNLRANNYICHFSVFSRELLEGGELFLSEFDGSQDHDMILRLTERAKKISHVQKIMYYWRSHSGSVASGIEAKTYAVDAAKRAVSAHLKRKGFNNFEISSTRAFATIFRIAYEIKEYPLVSIIIPNKDHVEDLRRCINSILERTFYNNFEIVIVENNSKKKETFDYYQELSKDRRIKVVTYTGRFNYSAINNLGVKESSGEYLLFLNNDCEVITRLWIEEMLMYAQREDVGAVGVKLLYPNREIQHAGIVIGMGEHRVAGHVMCRFPYGVSGYMGKLWYAQMFRRLPQHV